VQQAVQVHVQLCFSAPPALACYCHCSDACGARHDVTQHRDIQIVCGQHRQLTCQQGCKMCRRLWDTAEEVYSCQQHSQSNGSNKPKLGVLRSIVVRAPVLLAALLVLLLLGLVIPKASPNTCKGGISLSSTKG
jgi:hypothetical protein